MPKLKSVGFLLLTAALLISGCAATQVSYRTNPQFRERSREMHAAVVLPPKIKVYQIDAGGIREEIETWSREARNNILTAVQKELSTRMTATLDVLTEDSLAESKTWPETRALYDAVSAMVFLHTYSDARHPNHVFEEKLTNFDYSLGPEVSALAPGAHAFLFLDAEDHEWTGGRKALQTLGVIAAVGAGVATGVMIIPRLGGAGTSIRAALIDARTGDILWINGVTGGAGAHIKDPASASELVARLFKDFPGYDEK
jgi:hypothetical protein